MQDNILVNYREDVQKCVDSFCALAEKHAEPESKTADMARELKDFCEDKLKDFKPRIMVYGIYNAGKSSIINELIREDKAKVQDVPTTDRIDSYEWNGYVIDDTPGVGAPIKHEEVTQEHLKRADIVLFVISTTGSNELEQNYRRMKSIVDAGKKLIIVLNDKASQLEANDEAIQLIKMKVIQNMEQVGIAKAKDSYHFVVVNAIRARKGRLEQKETFWNKSHMAELEQVMLTELKESGGFDVLQRTVLGIENHMRHIMSSLEQTEGEHKVEFFNDLLEDLRDQEKSIKESMNREITFGTQSLANNLPELIWSQSRQGEKDVDEASIHKLVKEHEERLIDHIDKSLSSQFESVCQNLSDMVKQQLVEASLAASQPGNRIEMDTAGAIQTEVLKDVLGQVRERCQACADFSSSESSSVAGLNVGAEALRGMADGELLKAVGGKVGKELLKTGLGKTLSKSVVGKFLLPVVPNIPIVTIITVLSVVKSLLGGDGDAKRKQQEAEARNERMRQLAEARQQAHEQLRQNFRYFADDLRNKLLGPVFSNIEIKMRALKQPITSEIQKLKADKRNLADDLEKMHLLLNDCEQLRYEITRNEQIG